MWIQAQAVLYDTEPKAVFRMADALANAVRVARESGAALERVSLSLGDASAQPMLTEAELEQLRACCAPWLELSCRFFGFNSGFGRGQNLLAEGCGADYLLLMNPDILVEPRFFLSMLQPMEEPGVGLVEARQTPVEHPKEYDPKSFETPWASFACVLVRGSVWRQLNGLDADSFFMYCEDVDFSWRLRTLGYSIYYQPLAPVYHAKRLNAGGTWQPSDTELYHSSLSALLLAHKWSAARREKDLLLIYEESDKAYYREAAAEFRRRKEAGELPAPQKAGAGIARFTRDGYYCGNRFIL